MLEDPKEDDNVLVGWKPPAEADMQQVGQLQE